MNGWTPTLFKLQLIVTPIIFAAALTLGTWLVRSVNLLTQTQAVMYEKLDSVIQRDYSKDAARADHLELRRSIIEEVFSKLPPQHLIRQVDSIERRLIAIEKTNVP